MVGLHVVNDDVIELGDIGYLIDLGKELIGLKGLGQINDGLFLIIDEIGVIGNPLVGDGPQPLEEIGGSIIDPDPVAIRLNLNSCH
jgi:hypothetical protein